MPVLLLRAQACSKIVAHVKDPCPLLESLTAGGIEIKQMNNQNDDCGYS